MSTKSLLVVEDEVLVARDIKSRLTRMGYNVVDTVYKGRIAIEQALALKPDLILMDIHLADEIDGIEAAVEIRKQFDVPIIFCTAYSNQETLDRAKVSDPYGYVLKPFDNRELEINIEIALYKHRIEKDLSSTRNRLDATLTSISDGVIATSLQGEICLYNPMAARITGWSKEKAEAMDLASILPLGPFESSCEVLDTCLLEKPQSVANLRQILRCKNGSEVAIEISSNIITTRTDQLAVFTFRDISQQILFERQIRRSTFYDELTDLPNRALFIDRLESSLNRRKRGVKDNFAVAFFGLDGFASINEGLGHELGDQLLQEVAKRIALTVRPEDSISRFSGDIFAVLFDPLDSATGAIQACQRIQEAICDPVRLGTTTLDISASAGIVLNQELYRAADEMVRDADTALNRAKLDAKGAYVIFDNAMYENAVRYIERKSSMQKAMLDGAFEVHFQPIVDVQNEKLVSLEALARWRHPEEGFISPAEFIPIAERTGLILPLGEFVLRSVCRQIGMWQSEGFNGFRVAVNLSARQFEDNVSGMVKGILSETGVSPECLTLEITEGIMMKNVEQNIKMLEDLRDHGISISIDDFGTGYSSLAYLKRFPLNTLKIDISFIREITTNMDDREITRTIIAMGQNLQLKVLAEGVETNEQVEILKDGGCDYIQGYYYSRPLTADRVITYLEEHSLITPVRTAATV